MMYEPDPCRNDRKPKPKKKREPNLCKKERDVENPYEVWKSLDGSWEWRVLSKTQNPTNEAKNPYSTWFCGVKSPYTYERFELGSVYASEVREMAVKVQ
ncbi:uncharacterized protein METZ01_LOCUS260731 [marine metagenome]|uniref:Uncharacterized protein n=1 Tax=marine metagenome TaxID=408172 RepID=A0A382J984_9ZZZZ